MKKNLIIKIIIPLLFIGLLPIHGYSFSPSEIFEKVKDSIVVVKVFDENGKMMKQGSGVLVSFERVATNYHVVAKKLATNFNVVVKGNSYEVCQDKQIISATIYQYDEKRDICILKINGFKGSPSVMGKTSKLKVGDPIYAVGAPQGLELSLSNGIISQLRGDPPPIIQITAAISPGSSGGGLFDSEGRLLGLTTFYIEGGQSLNFAMPAEWIGEMIEIDDKIKAWQEVVKNDPNNASTWKMLGDAYFKLLQFDSAIKGYQEAIKIDPNDKHSWEYLRLSYNNVQQYNNQLKTCQDAIKIFPKDASMWRNLGSAYFYLKQYNNELKTYQDAIKIFPKDASILREIGGAYSNLKQYNSAIKAYQEAIKIDPTDKLSWASLANAYFNLKQYNSAIKAYQEAIKIDPTDKHHWEMLSYNYFFAAKKKEALNALKELQHLDPEAAASAFKVMFP